MVDFHNIKQLLLVNARVMLVLQLSQHLVIYKYNRRTVKNLEKASKLDQRKIFENAVIFYRILANHDLGGIATKSFQWFNLMKNGGDEEIRTLE